MREMMELKAKLDAQLAKPENASEGGSESSSEGEAE